MSPPALPGQEGYRFVVTRYRSGGGGKLLKNPAPRGGKLLKKSAQRGPILLITDSVVTTRKWVIKGDFDQGVWVDPFRFPKYYLVIGCDRCSGTAESKEFVSGEVDLGVIEMDGCGS
jgi:hypothetical protein